MTFATTGQVQVHPGRDAEFIDAVRAQAKLTEGVGGTTVLRQAVFAGPDSGTYRLISIYETSAARAAAIDALRQEATIPIRDFLTSDNPGGVGLGRSLLNGVSDGAAEAVQQEVTFTALAQPQPGHNATLLAAIPETQAQFAKHGALASAWQTFASGPNSGIFVLGIGAESMTVLQAALDNVQAEGPGPIVRLLQAGAIELQASTVSFRVPL